MPEGITLWKLEQGCGQVPLAFICALREVPLGGGDKEGSGLDRVVLPITTHGQTCLRCVTQADSDQARFSIASVSSCRSGFDSRTRDANLPLTA